MTGPIRRKWRALRRTAGDQLRRLGGALIGRPMTAALVALIPVVLGAILAIWPKEIQDATQAAVLGPRGPLHFWVTVFWLVVIGWTWLLYLRLRSDDQKESSRLRDLTSAIHRVPNYAVVENYADYFDAITAKLSAVATSEDPVQLAGGIRAAMVIVAGLARDFRRGGSHVHYGANVMLHTRPRPALFVRCFDDEILNALRFFDRSQSDPCALSAILFLPSPLLYAGGSADERRTVPVIALPVPHTARDTQGHVLALPGAPWALLTGTASVYEDARLMPDHCLDFAAPIRTEITAYFSEQGAGREIRSLASFRIGDELEPVGVLNIDCAETHLLGSTPEYYPTFFALMTPVLRLLVEPVTRYAALTLGHTAGSQSAVLSNAPAPLVAPAAAPPTPAQPTSGS